MISKHTGILTIIIFLVLPWQLPAKDLLINLDKQEIDIPNRHYIIAKVINTTEDDHCIGYVLSSADYHRIPVYLEHGIEKDIATFLKNQMDGSIWGEALIIRINRLFIYEILFEESRISNVELNISFIKAESGHYTEIYRAALVSEKSTSFGKANHIRKNIAAAFQEAFNKFEQNRKSNRLISINLSKEELVQNPFKSFSEEAFVKTDRKKKGIFWTYDDFFFNLPDTTTKFFVNYRNKKSSNDSSVLIKNARIYLMKDNKKILSAWGFADGKNIFSKTGKYYFPIQITDSGYYIRLETMNNVSNVSFPIVMGGILGGAIGGAIAAAIAIPAGKAASVTKMVFKLDPVIGTYSFFKEKEFNKVESRVIFFSSGKNKPGQYLALFFNDEFVCKLYPESWYAITLPGNVKTIRVKLKSSKGPEYSNEIKPVLFQTHIYLCYDRKNKPPFFRKVTTDAAESMLGKLNPENRIK